MQIAQNDVNQIQQVLTSAKQILVVTPGKANVDRMAASLAFYLTMPQIGKSVSVVSPDPVTVDVSNLVGIDKVKNTLDSKNFVISLDYVEGSIEKVSYNIEGEKFNLVIEPRPGFTFSQDKVSYSNSGASADLIFVIGAASYEDLGKFAQTIQEMQGRATVVNIDTSVENRRFGKINIVSTMGASVSEVVLQLLKQLGLPYDQDTATNLFSGVAGATQNFTSPRTTADSFEAAATLLRAGAQTTGGAPNRPASLPPYNDTDAVVTGAPSPFQTRPAVPSPVSLPFVQSSNQDILKQQTNSTEAPPDWLKPKIFRSRPNTGNQPKDYTPSEGRTGVS